ncbi:Cytosolic Fe-S cluster assembly factor nar1 [Knufia obscura]|uniref:Cytosolic Fe-S cluster assembly factor NAR1 n=2 Tax=Knufia TaxID=430999 RepID=A0AAN8EYE0_9EURO|nr:Cytosolic Fe-S cluster assembly factor nar1 [Knufia obscura]KAK5956521.1 Cytosolic Fe-S cluster assembly factor nar1 [Knufia fluminis]
MSSAILSADDLNDFISPGVACIKPVETLPKADESNPYEVTTEDKVQAQNPAPASISLTDCLACSGCVTSAEAVLVSLQSHTEVLNTLDNHASLSIPDLLTDSTRPNVPPNAKIFVASVSPQVRASIAATFGLSERRAGRLIEQFLSGSQGLRIGGKNNSGFNYVFDTNRMREACLVLGADEVAGALAEKSQAKPVITSACPGWVCYAEKTHPHVLPHMSTLKSPQALSGTLIKSVLSRKLNIHPSQVWHLALMPCFDKKLEASREELTDRWWRDSNPADTDTTPIRDVDCVITSRELLSLASARGTHLASLIPLTDKPLPRSQREPFPDPVLSKFLLNRNPKDTAQRPEAATSGGYLHHILLTQQALHSGSSITTTRGRNNDVTEYSLVSPEGKAIFKCARYYGFRNIQNLVRKLKPARASKMPGAANRRLGGASARGEGSDYAYVEVMACPGGCTNGGGQIKLEDVADVIAETRGEVVDGKVDKRSPQSQKEWLTRVDEAYFSAESEDSEEDDQFEKGVDFDMNGFTGMRDYEATTNGHTNGEDAAGSRVVNGIDTGSIQDVLRHWSEVVDVPLEKLCYTTYRKVESDVGKSKKEVKQMGDSARIAAIAGASGGGW